eukprot:6314103-Amphidinium_carterae.1
MPPGSHPLSFAWFSVHIVAALPRLHLVTSTQERIAPAAAVKQVQRPLGKAAAKRTSIVHSGTIARTLAARGQQPRLLPTTQTVCNSCGQSTEPTWKEKEHECIVELVFLLNVFVFRLFAWFLSIIDDKRIQILALLFLSFLGPPETPKKTNNQ